MAEIILFRPKSARSVIPGAFPLSLIYIATPLVNKGFRVKIIDEEVSPDWLKEVEDAVDESTICAGTSVMTGGSIKSALVFSEAVKKIKPIPVVWGGIHPSFLPEQTLRNKLVDIVVVGEGEQKFLKLVEQIKNKGRLDNIKGVAFKCNGRISYAGPEEDFLELNALTTPAYHLIDRNYYASYRRPYFRNKEKALDLNVDRGCPYRCAFCYNLKFNNRRWRGMRSEKVLDILEEVTKKYNVDAITFVSDNFFTDKNRVYEICKGIIDRKIDIEWHSDIRIDTFLRYEDDLFKLAEKSGCVSLTFGIESGSDRILKMINKDITRADVLKSCEKAKKFSFSTHYHFMMGFPEETKRDIVETLKLIRVISGYRSSSVNGPHVFVPYPGTPLYDRCLELGFIPPKRLEGWIDYIWYRDSKLPWFSKNHKSYLREINTICTLATHKSIGNSKNIFVRLIFNIQKSYCKLRFIGLIRGIRLFDLDTGVIRALIHLLRLASLQYRKFSKNINQK